MTSQCNETVNYLTGKYWETLNTIGIEGDELDLDTLIQKMYNYNGVDQIMETDPFFTKVRDYPDDKRRHEYILDFLSNGIKHNLSPDDLGLSDDSKCNFLGDDPSDIADWGMEGGPHYGGDNIMDFLKHNFPFLKPPIRSRGMLGVVIPNSPTFGSFTPSDFTPPDDSNWLARRTLDFSGGRTSRKRKTKRKTKKKRKTKRKRRKSRKTKRHKSRKIKRHKSRKHR